MLKVFIFPPDHALLPSFSPYCSKLVFYLTLAKIPFETIQLQSPDSAPKGKLPFIEMDGKRIADSELIIDTLCAHFGDKVDAHLKEEQRHLRTVYTRFFEEHLFWVRLYLAWQPEEHFAIIRPKMLRGVPFFIRPFVLARIRKRILRALDAQGMGRHSVDEVISFGIRAIEALEYFLDDKPYFLGDAPSSLDCTAYAFIGALLYSPIPSPMHKAVQASARFQSYAERMQRLLRQ